MATQILKTKLYVPPARPELVSRPRLIERLDAGIRGKLTLISAPAGFGKTTLVSEWIGQPDHSVAWLSLDENDNDINRFLAYLVATLQTIEADIGKSALSMLQTSQSPPAEAILTTLINEIAAVPDRSLLVLDDYHLIEDQTTHDALTFLLRNLPPNMRLVIVTREDPPLPLANLRARGKMTELRGVDLRFTSSEAAEFLNQAMGLDLSPEDITALETRTEGWIAGLQLAALSMQGSKDPSSLVESFTGSHRHVLDYLVQEVLEQQSESIQTFLLQTSILNRLTGSLCDALTGESNGQATLEYLEHANLFIVSLDNERRWYRYHHLFAELLRQHLDAAHPNWMNDLHSKAVIWYEASDDLSEAVHHALATDDFKTTTRLIEKGAAEALKRSDFRFVLSYVDLLPESALESSPWLFVYHAWTLLLTGQVQAASSRLEDTDWLLNSISDDDEIRKREMLGYIAGLKGVLAGWRRDYPNMIDFTNQATENLPKDNWARGYCALLMGGQFWGNGNLAASKDAFAESVSVAQASGNTTVAVSSACHLAHSTQLEGHLQQAAKILQDTFQLAEQDGRALPVAGYIHVAFARVLYELNELDLASQHLMESIKLCRLLADGRSEKTCHCFLARVSLAKGDLASAADSIQNAEQFTPSPGISWDLRGGEYSHIWLWLKGKELDKVAGWVEEDRANADNVWHFKTKLTFTMRARALIALGCEQPEGAYLDQALDLLDDLLGMAENNGWGSKVIEILALQALALQEQGDTAQAMTILERALSLAKPEGYVRTFVDEGPSMARLLYEALSRGIVPDYVRRLLAAFPTAEPQPADPSATQAPASDLIEPLSEREIEILQRIAEGLTNQEIASRLFLSLHTIKAHARNIYSKLGVHNRTEAVARARALGILPAN